jgi:hypothetical protein
MGTWLFAYLQGSARGIGYVGTQAAVVFIWTLVQGDGPPISIMPGIDRFAGITIGMVTLLFVSLLLAPVTDEAAPASTGDSQSQAWAPPRRRQPPVSDLRPAAQVGGHSGEKGLGGLAKEGGAFRRSDNASASTDLFDHLIGATEK